MSNTKYAIGRRSVLRFGGAALAAPMLMRTSWAQETYVCKIAHSEAIGSPFTTALNEPLRAFFSFSSLTATSSARVSVVLIVKTSTT